MKAVFPGKPQAKLNAVDTVAWEGNRIVTYISGTSLLILNGPNDLLQTISHAEEEQLVAVAISDITGKIAVSTKSRVYLYRPYGLDIGALQWSLQAVLTTSVDDRSITCLSWGTSDELLITGSSLTLFTTTAPPKEAWTKKLANAAKLAALSPDGSLIATTAWRDRLVKIWKRLWSGPNEERFDVTYLPHPTTVTGLHWHTRSGREQHNGDAVLYTTCADQKLRVWAHTDPHGLQNLQLWAEIDLLTCIETPESALTQGGTPRRYVVVMDKWQFESLVERAAAVDGEDEHSIQIRKHLVDIAYRDPDICIILDDRGNMSAWGLERVGCKARHKQDIFKIVDIQGVPVHFPVAAIPEEDYLRPYIFEGEGTDCSVNLLLNFFDGRLQWLSAPVENLFDTAEHGSRFTSDAEWTGHAEPVERLFTSKDQSWLLSISGNGEVVCWDQVPESAVTLVRRSITTEAGEVMQACLMPDNTHASLLYDGSIALWAFEKSRAFEVVRIRYHVSGKPLAMFLAAYSTPQEHPVYYVAVVTSEMLGKVFSATPDHGNHSQRLLSFCDFEIDEMGKASSISVPFQHPNDISHTFPLCAHKSSGLLSMFETVLDIDRKEFEWLEANNFETNTTDPCLVSSSANGKAGVVDTSGIGLTIWDCADGLLEYTESFEMHDPVRITRWMTTASGYALLALGFAHKVFIYGQRRFDYLDGHAAWTRLHQIDISQLTNLHVVDCSWLQQCEMLVAAGNQMFVYGNDIEVPRTLAADLMLSTKDARKQDLRNVVAALNGGLPVFHPYMIALSIAGGKFKAVQKILTVLHRTLKFYTEGEPLESSLAMTHEDFSQRVQPTRLRLHKRRISFSEYPMEEESGSITPEIASSLSEKLLSTRLPYVTKKEQTRLAVFAESLGFVEKHRLAVDEWGLRYLVFFQERCLRLDVASANVEQLSWREIAWAYHCTNQEVLVDVTSQRFKGKMLWSNARECGMFMWMNDLNALRFHFENIARNEYSKTDERNPVDCSLYYLALRKKTVLMGLWRMASWNREQAGTSRLLANNFSDPRWQTAAQKNAYALLGKRRFEYAAAFFLLADKLKDAVNILAGQLGDIQLAIAVARVYEGDDGPVLTGLLESRVLPHAVENGDHWLAHWAFSMLKRYDDAMRCLVFPLPTLISILANRPEPQIAKSFRKEDPALITLYKHLRDSPLHTHEIQRKSAKSPLNPEEEWDFVLRTARAYCRAGAVVLALDLVRTWRFPVPSLPKLKNQPEAQSQSQTNGESHILDSPLFSPTSPPLRPTTITPYTNGDVSISSPRHGPPTASPDRPPLSPTLSRRRSTFSGRRPSFMLGRRPSILERDEDEENGELDAAGTKDGVGAGAGAAAGVKSMKMGLLDEGKTRKQVVQEPSAASILDDFAF